VKEIKIRVCHFTSVHVRTDVRVFYKQCVSLANAGYDVHFVVADGKGDDIVKGVKIHDIGKMPNRLARMIVSPVKMLSLIIKLRCKIYQFHDPELLPAAFILKLLTRAKVIYDSHECYSDFFLHKDYLPAIIRPFCSQTILKLERFVGKRLDWMIVTTEFHANTLKGINRNLSIVYNYPLLSEWEQFSETVEIKKERNICYIGAITDERGITQLIKSIENIDCTLHLAGTYEPPDYRNELVRLKGWEKVVEYGYVNRPQAVDIIQKSVLGVVLFLPKPIHYTSLSTKSFEYMAGGIACLISDFPIYKDIIEKYNCGLCVDPTSLEQIATGITYLLDNPEIARDMGTNGKKMIKEVYNWENQEKVLLGIYSRLLNNKDSNPA
jgi:glycosyltransferase involved in cell wall biosynthesis